MQLSEEFSTQRNPVQGNPKNPRIDQEVGKFNDEMKFGVFLEAR